MDVLGDVCAGCGEVVGSQRPIVRVPARFEDAEPVPEVAELVPDERVLDGLDLGWLMELPLIPPPCCLPKETCLWVSR